MQLSASPGFANHDLKKGPFYHDLMMLTNMYIHPSFESLCHTVFRTCLVFTVAKKMQYKKNASNGSV